MFVRVRSSVERTLLGWFTLDLVEFINPIFVTNITPYPLSTVWTDRNHFFFLVVI